MRRSPSPSGALSGAAHGGLRGSRSTGLLPSGGSPPRPQRPTRLLGAGAALPPNYCFSCLPSGLSFSQAAAAKQQGGPLAPLGTLGSLGSLGSMGTLTGMPPQPPPRSVAAAAAAAAAAAGRSPGAAPQPDRAYIGFATLPEQVHRKSVKRGFDFTLMVVGETGLGKSTLVNALFLSDLYRDRRVPDVSERVHRTTSIERKVMDIEERGVKLRLTIVDTPGFGDAINCEESWLACCAYVDEQFRQYFTDESGLNRRNIQDNRVHCCLYFIPPYGHGLRQLDVEFMRRLHRKVNLVPVIAKADTLTAPEVRRLKERILTDLEESQIQIYQFPECDSDEDEEFKQQDRELKACVPFAVVGANGVLDVAGRSVRGRLYPWGVVEVENPAHCDFARLRTMLVSTHMQDLKDVTQDVHYENFRAQCLSQMSLAAAGGRERSKLKRDSALEPHAPSSDTDRLLQQKEEEIRRMQNMLTQMQEQLKAQGRLPSPKGDGSRDSIVNV